mmetsp:Transcript_2564/g.5930  ORF Transcript_2564/g.5930 Transcript_2564/m.5930 type:complete len:240 (+) Transcript_2564:89-808(+)
MQFCRPFIIVSTSWKYPKALSLGGMSGRLVTTRSELADCWTMTAFRLSARSISCLLQGATEFICSSVVMKWCWFLRFHSAMPPIPGSETDLFSRKRLCPGSETLGLSSLGRTAGFGGFTPTGSSGLGASTSKLTRSRPYGVVGTLPTVRGTALPPARPLSRKLAGMGEFALCHLSRCPSPLDDELLLLRRRFRTSGPSSSKVVCSGHTERSIEERSASETGAEAAAEPSRPKGCSMTST